MKWAASFLLVVAAAGAARVSAQTGAPLYRVFLPDGTALISYGEWARVDDKMIFTMPLRAAAGPSDLHLVTLPIDRIDLPRTEQYADAVRATQYAATRGEADFARLSGEVAQALNQVAVLTDPAERLAAAERARRALADWPGAHYGYRAREVSDIVGVLDDVISTLRASTGGPRYELALTATTPPPPAEVLRGEPSEEEVIEHLLAAAGAVSSPAEKVSLLQTVLAAVDRALDWLPSSVSARVRTAALGGMAEERRIDGVYGTLRAGILESASQLARRADVRGLERLRQRARAEDQKLGARRVEDMAGVFATIDAHLDAAHRLRLQLDLWLTRIDALRAYKRQTGSAFAALATAQDSLEAIRTLAGPAPQRLRLLQQRLGGDARRLALVDPPRELAGVHAVLRSAFALAEQAVQLRRDAIDHTDLDLARQASSAAAGALLMVGRARADLDAALRSPIDQP